MIIPFISSLLLIVAIVIFLGLTPEKVTEDIMKFFTPKRNLREKVKNAQGKKDKKRLSETLKHINEGLIQTGKGTQFTVVCTISLCLMVAGAFFSVMINNVFLLPVLSILLAIIPFLYVKRTIGYYESHIEEEIETTLSIITTSYIANKDIIKAVNEKLPYIKPPLNAIFKSFVGETMGVNSDTKKALFHLRGKVDNEIFKEWVDTLISCQDDRKLCDTLLPVVAKLTDVRIVNNELKNILYEPKKEYFAMVLMVVCNIPLLYFLNKDWYAALMFSLQGKIVLGICGAVILVTALFMTRYTKAIKYRR
ncbi:MAG: hypothetical protein R3Y35_11205 [Clostridia bacterium]